MFSKLNEAFIAIVLLIALIAMAISIIVIFLPFIPGYSPELEATSSMHSRPDFFLTGEVPPLSSQDSPKFLSINISTPALKDDDALFVDIYNGGEQVGHIDCLDEYDGNYTGLTSLECKIPIPYNYDPVGDYHLFGVLTSDNTDYLSGPLTVDIDWGGYEQNFWAFSWLIIAIIGIVYVILLIPVSIFIWVVACSAKRDKSAGQPGSLFSLRARMRYKNSVLSWYLHISGCWSW